MKGSQKFYAVGRIARLLIATAIGFSAIAGPLGTGFTYQGRLERDGAPLDGVAVELRFELWTAQNGGSSLGNPSFATASVVDGVFSATVNVAGEFGPLAFIGQPRWLQISVRQSPLDPFISLQPRQELTPAPQALFAPGGGAGPTNALDSADGDPANALWIDADGRVGIGTMSPGQQLDVVGAIRSTGTGSTGVSVFNPNDTGDSVTLGWQNDVARIRVSGSGGSTGFDIQRNEDVSLIRLLNNGNLGIRQPAPLARLHVTTESQGLLSSALENDEVIIEGDDAAIGLYSSSGGAWGSALALKEVASGAIVDTWGIARRTSPNGSDLYFTYGPSDNYALNPATMVFNDVGDVGIGTNTPTARLHVAGNGLFAGDLSVRDSNDVSTVSLERATGSTGGGAVLLRAADASQTVELEASEGVGGGAYLNMWNSAGVQTVRIDADQGDAANVEFFDDLGQSVIELDALEGDRAVIRLRNRSNQEVILLDTDGAAGRGRVITQELEITGGADLSEQFDIQSTAIDGAVVHAAPGMVVCIDPANVGTLVVASAAYDPTVAGVVSGAGGVRPGMLMGQRASEADGQYPVALTGRVYVRCDASFGAIRPGDLLTTSETPGHAMKVSDSQRAPGAVLGKAMSSLEVGQGLVLVLVSLQ